MVNITNKDKGEIHEEDEIRVNSSPREVLMIQPKLASHVIKEVMYQSIVENCADIAIYKYIMEFLAQDPIKINNKE